MKALFSASFILLLLVSCLTEANTQNQVAGSLQDNTGKPLAYATVTLLKAGDSSLVRGDFTTEQGNYNFENPGTGIYLLGFTMLGFEQAYSKTFVVDANQVGLDLGPMFLQPATALLGEVEVVSKRPFLEQKIDRTVVNVANSITNAGGTALQVLQRSPGVQVNALTKSISLAGKQGVVLMVNNKISRLPNDAVVDMLSGMNADNIDRIELIHTPPGNFDAEGNAGIIHIILKRSGDQGLNGGYSAKAGYGRGRKYGAGMFFNYRKNKINLYGNYSLDHNLNPQAIINYRLVKQGADVLETFADSDRPHTPTTTQNANFGVDFQLSKKTVLGVLGTFFDRNWYMEAYNDVSYSKNGLVDSLLRMPNTETNHSSSRAANINLAHQFSADQSLNIDLDFIDYGIDNPSWYDIGSTDANGNIISRQELRLSKKTPIRIAVAKLDYTMGFGKNTRIETGIKGTSMRFDNDIRVDRRPDSQDWQVIPEFTSLSHLDDLVTGAYLNFSTKLDQKTDLKATLRYEYTDTRLDSAAQVPIVDRTYGSFFPALFITRTMAAQQSLTLSYSRRITRPQIAMLAPFLLFADPTTLIGGNPELQPSFNNTLNLQYALKTWRFGLSYSLEKDPISIFPTIDVAKNRQFTSWQNFNNQQVLSANIYLPWRPVRWLDMSANIYVNAIEMNLDLEGVPLQIRNINYGFNSTNTIRLPQKFTLEISGAYNAPNYWGVTYWKGTGNLDIGIEKNFGEKWGKLSFNIKDLFVSNNWFGTTDQPEIDLLTTLAFNFSERTFMLSWNNTFGNNKLKSARVRQTGGMEEMRRI